MAQSLVGNFRYFGSMGGGFRSRELRKMGFRKLSAFSRRSDSEPVSCPEDPPNGRQAQNQKGHGHAQAGADANISGSRRSSNGTR